LPVPIVLTNGAKFRDPEGRIREYCKVEVYRAYDGRRAIDNSITMSDVKAANELYAMIDRYDSNESSRIVGAKNVEAALAVVDDLDLALMSNTEWAAMMPRLRTLLAEFTAIRAVGLAKATKILHLKRPHLFPILDSFVVKFLTGKDPVLVLDKESSLDLGLNALKIARFDLVTNEEGFRELGANLADLPIPLTCARMYDILCWTEEKWVIRGITSARFGTAGKSIPELPRKSPGDDRTDIDSLPRGSRATQ